MDALEKAKQKIREDAERRIAELEEASALAAKYGMTLAPVDEVEVVDVDPKVGRVRRHKKGWRETIIDVVSEFQSGATRGDLKKRLAETHLGPRLAQTDAAFYGAISKAISKGEIVEHKEHLFTPFLHRRFVEEVKAGRREELRGPVSAKDGNKMVVMDFVSSHPGVDSDAIFSAIQRENPGSMRNKNSVYNLLARMVRDQELAKEGKSYFPIGFENGDAAASSDANAEEDDTLFGVLNPNSASKGA